MSANATNGSMKLSGESLKSDAGLDQVQPGLDYRAHPEQIAMKEGQAWKPKIGRSIGCYCRMTTRDRLDLERDRDNLT